MSFVSDIALTFIAFNVGSYFKREVIRSTGPRILIVTLFEALLSGVVVFLAMRLLFGLSADFRCSSRPLRRRPRRRAR